MGTPRTRLVAGLDASRLVCDPAARVKAQMRETPVLVRKCFGNEYKWHGILHSEQPQHHKRTRKLNPAAPVGVVSPLSFRMSTRRGGARGQPRAESPSSSGFGWKEVVLCVVGAVPLAILYRHFLIPTLAGLGTVRWLKSLSLDDVAHGAGSMIGWSAKDVDSWASRTGHKVRVFLWTGRGFAAD